jgi:hypothetical protein
VWQALARQRGAFFSGKILLTDLDPVDASRCGRFDLAEENFTRVRGMFQRERVPVRDVAENRLNYSLTQAGHE